jgi:phosphatidylglycerol lysyltransferase
VNAAERSALDHALDAHGRSPLSFLARYEAPWRLFGSADGVVCYLEEPRTAVGWSDPLCAPDSTAAVLGEFAAAMRRQRRSLCLVAVSEQTTRLALEAGFSALKIGEEPSFDLSAWRPPRGNRGKKLRWAVNHARRAGVDVAECRPSGGRDAAVEAEILDVLAQWRATLGRAEPKGIMATRPLEQAERKRLFVARRGGRAEAVLACAPLAEGGWYLEDLFRLPAAVNGATELLVVEALDRLRASGAASAAFALAPMRGVDRQLDPRARWLGRGLALVIRGFDRRYGFRSIARYESRFEPSEWRSRYVAFLPALPRPAAVRAAVRCLSA